MEKLKNIVKETLIIEESIEKQKEMTQEIKEKNDGNIKIVLAKLEAYMDEIHKELKSLLPKRNIPVQIQTAEHPINIIFTENGWSLQPTSRFVTPVSKHISRVAEWKNNQYYAENAHYIFKTLEDEIISSIEKQRESIQKGVSSDLSKVSKTSEELNKSLEVAKNGGVICE